MNYIPVSLRRTTLRCYRDRRSICKPNSSLVCVGCDVKTCLEGKLKRGF